MKKKLNDKPILLFLLSCFLISPVFAVFGVILMMIMSMTGLLGTQYGTLIVVYLGYFFIIDYVFYGSSKRQNQYIASLEKNKKYTVFQDVKLFLKQEGVLVMISYAVYAIGALIAEIYIPETENLILNILKLSYRTPIFPAFVLSFPIWIRYLVCLVCFSILYCLMMIWHRARIRKKWC